MTSYPDFPSIQPITDYEIYPITNTRTVSVFQGEDGYLYADLESLCRVFCLNEKEEAVRIQKHVVLKTQLGIVAHDKGPAQLCLRLGFIGTWLLSLPIQTVEKEEDQEALIVYQQNAAQILEEAFCEGRLVERPFIAALLQENSPAAAAYKEALAKLGLARDQLIFDAKRKSISGE